MLIFKNWQKKVKFLAKKNLSLKILCQIKNKFFIKYWQKNSIFKNEISKIKLKLAKKVEIGKKAPTKNY